MDTDVFTGRNPSHLVVVFAILGIGVLMFQFSGNIPLFKKQFTTFKNLSAITFLERNS